MKRALKLLYLTHHRPHLVRFRAGAFAEQMANKGHQVTVVCISENRRFSWREEHLNGVRYLESPDSLPGKLRSGWDPWDTLRRIPGIRAAWREADIVHAFETRPATIFPLLWHQRRHPKPLLIDWNDWWGRGGLLTEQRPRWYQSLFGGMETWFEEHFRTRAAFTTVISGALAERAAGLGVPRDRIVKITGGAHPDVFRPQASGVHRERFGLPETAILFGFSAMDVNMDLPLVFAALERARAVNPDIALFLTGRSMPDPCPDGVFSLGLLPFEQLPDALACADVCLLPFPEKPANRGRWPNKVMDYLACGRPVITHPTGEMAGLFADGKAGRLVEEGPDPMAAAMLELAADPGLRARMGSEGRRLAETTYSWTSLAERLQNCYDLAMTRHG